jgi:hypothetical protein
MVQLQRLFIYRKPDFFEQGAPSDVTTPCVAFAWQSFIWL